MMRFSLTIGAFILVAFCGVALANDRGFAFELLSNAWDIQERSPVLRASFVSPSREGEVLYNVTRVKNANGKGFLKLDATYLDSDTAIDYTLVRKDKEYYKIFEGNCDRIGGRVPLPAAVLLAPLGEVLNDDGKVFSNAQHGLEVNQGVNHMGIVCDEVVYQLPMKSDEELYDLSEERRSRYRARAASRGESFDEDRDFLTPLIRGMVFTRKFYIDRETGFAFAWKAYNRDGELINEQFIGDYEFGDTVDPTLFQIPCASAN